MAKDKADIWMPWYIGDYLADTMRLTTEQHGAYMLLLGEHWMKGPIPDDDEVLSAITRLPLDRWMKTRGLLLGYFWLSDGFWYQKRALAEKEKAESFKMKQKANGSKGGRPKRNNQEQNNPNETQTKPNTKPKRNPNESPSPSPSQLEEKEKNTVCFEEFWEVARGQYRDAESEIGSKAEARKAWDKLDPTQELATTMGLALIAQAKAKTETKAVKGFASKFKHVCRWIKNECWTDDVVEADEEDDNEAWKRAAL